jgi:hypothetical protein
MEIREVYWTGDEILVLAELDDSGRITAEEPMTVSDHLALDLPNANIRYIIIGEQPLDRQPRNLEFIANRSEIERELSGASRVYRR